MGTYGGGSSGTFSGTTGTQANGQDRTPPQVPAKQAQQPEEDTDAWALAASGGAAGRMIVLFEISVVKVSLNLSVGLKEPPNAR